MSYKSSFILLVICSTILGGTQLTIEKDWLKGKLKDLDLSKKLEMVDKSKSKIMSVVKQCELLHLSRSNIYYADSVK